MLSQFNPTGLYNGGAPTSVLLFLLRYSRLRNFFKDVVESAMNIANRLFKTCEPGDEHVHQWMEVLNELLDHKHDAVAKWTLRLLGTIFNRFLQTGQDLSAIPAGGLDKSLSHNLYLTCLKFHDSTPVSYSLFYNPSLLELAKAASDTSRKCLFIDRNLICC